MPDLEAIFKGAIGESRYAAMQALYDAGFEAGRKSIIPLEESIKPVYVEPEPVAPAIQEAAAVPKFFGTFFASEK